MAPTWTARTTCDDSGRSTVSDPIRARLDYLQGRRLDRSITSTVDALRAVLDLCGEAREWVARQPRSSVHGDRHPHRHRRTPRRT